MNISDFTILQKILKPYEMYNLYYFKRVKAFSIDSRTIKKGEAYIAICGTHHDGHDFIKEAIDRGASVIISQKYISVKKKVPFFIVENSIDALKKCASYIRKIKNPFVYAITGTVGKTTTKEILYHILKSDFKVLRNRKTENNILGVTKTILSLRNEEILILEFGTNKKGEIAELANVALPDVGVITFVKSAHLDGLGSLGGVLKEKVSLFNFSCKVKAVLNADDPLLSKAKIPNKTYWFSRKVDADVFAVLKQRNAYKVNFVIQGKYDLNLPFYLENFIYNFMAAILAAKIKGISLKKGVSFAQEFKNFPDMRMQAKHIGSYFILNDAYNANPYSFNQAFKMLKRYNSPKIAVIGDMLELDSKVRDYHESLAKGVMRANFKYCLTFGEHTVSLNKKLRKLGFKGAHHFSKHKDIADFIKKNAVLRKEFSKRYLIFIKGSRKMELEKIITYLELL